MALKRIARKGTTAQHAAFTGDLAELTVDTDKSTVVVHDGSTAGGHPLSKEGHNHPQSEVTDLTTDLAAKAPLASPALTGTPTAPTAISTTNTTQIATTAFVKAVVADIINGAPGALDTLNELAAAMGDDANFSATVTNSLALKANTSALATVATTGAYADLSGLPTLFSGAYADLSGKPTLGTAAAANTGDFAAASHNHTLANITDSGAMASLPEATSAQVRGFTNSAIGVTTRRLREAAALITPSGASNWTPDWAAFITADWNVTADRTINNPTNVIPGTTRAVKIRSSTATARTISFGNYYKGNLPTSTVTNAEFLYVTMSAISATEIVVSYIGYS